MAPMICWHLIIVIAYVSTPPLHDSPALFTRISWDIVSYSVLWQSFISSQERYCHKNNIRNFEIFHNKYHIILKEYKPVYLDIVKTILRYGHKNSILHF